MYLDGMNLYAAYFVPKMIDPSGMQSENREEEKKKGDKKEIKMTGWTYGSIGQGGEEFMFDTYHGDIILRKSN